MSTPGGLEIRFRRGDTVFHTYGGLDEGIEGVKLAKEAVQGIYDAPVKTTWKTGAFQRGSTQRHRKWLHRDMELGFHVGGTMATSWGYNDSEFRKIFDYEDDPHEEIPTKTVMEVETEMSGVRMLDVLMYEAPIFNPPTDPHKNQHGFVILRLRAGQPMWYEVDENGEDFPSAFESSSTSDTGTVTVHNPTDQVMHQYWVIDRCTPTIPDVQWVGGKGEREPGGDNGSRAITMAPITEIQGGAVVNLDPNELLIRDMNGTNILPSQGGKFFNYTIPPYTPPTELTVSYTDAPAGGARIELHQPRRWSRPWGLEWNW